MMRPSSLRWMGEQAARGFGSATSLNPSAGNRVVTADPRELNASEHAGDRSWSAWTYYGRRYRERGRQFTRSDSAWIVALASSPASVVERQIGWLGAVLAARGMPRYSSRSTSALCTTNWSGLSQTMPPN